MHVYIYYILIYYIYMFYILYYIYVYIYIKLRKSYWRTFLENENIPTEVKPNYSLAANTIFNTILKTLATLY